MGNPENGERHSMLHRILQFLSEIHQWFELNCMTLIPAYHQIRKRELDMERQRAELLRPDESKLDNSSSIS